MKKKYKKNSAGPVILFACDIASGRGLSCKDATGGLKNIYFMNHDDVVLDDFTFATVDDRSSVITAVANTPTIWKYELHLGNSLTQNVNSSPENGTTYFEQVLNLTLKKLTAEDNANILNLAYGHPTILVEDQMGNIMFVGLQNGADLTGGTAVTGDDMGDLNGYTLTFTGKERFLANFYTGDLDTDFLVNGV